MLNDRSSALSLLQTRRSARPRDLVGTGPSPDELAQILTIAARVPDHGKLAPWRFIVIDRDQRDAFARLLHEALDRENPEATGAHHAKADQFAHYQGALIVLVASPIPDHKIPVWEQNLSCGASGMNILHAAHALGYVGGWLTGWYARSETVRDAFCEPGQTIAGFFFIGSPGTEIEERVRPAREDVVSRWTPNAALSG